jgi:hypothetical protein
LSTVGKTPKEIFYQQHRKLSATRRLGGNVQIALNKTNEWQSSIERNPALLKIYYMESWDVIASERVSVEARVDVGKRRLQRESVQCRQCEKCKKSDWKLKGGKKCSNQSKHKQSYSERYLVMALVIFCAMLIKWAQ